MNQKSKEIIVQKFNGHETLTYQELSIIGDGNIIRALSDSPKNPALLEIKIGDLPNLEGNIICPLFGNGQDVVEKLQASHFSSTDIFHLTEYGEDILYQLQKEAVRDNQAAEAMALNKRIFVAALIGVAIAAIGVLIALLK